MTIIKIKDGNTIGGFTDVKMGGDGSLFSFIFNVNKRVVMPLQSGMKATFLDKNYGPIFGNGDIRVGSDSVMSNYHTITRSYEFILKEGVTTRDMFI